MSLRQYPAFTSPQELLKHAKRIEIATRAIVNNVFSGAYHSIFKGQGMEFTDLRPYLRGDDIRTIDWNITARTGSLHVRRYREERERTMMLVVDRSASMAFGSRTQSKAELAAELSALLAFSAITNNDRVGLLLFSNRREKVVPPRKGRKHALRIITEVLAQGPAVQGTDLNCALEFLARAIRRHSIVFLISDFFSPDFTAALNVAKRKHDCVALVLNDEREYQLPSLGWISVTDSETGQDIEVNTRNKRVREKYTALIQARARARLNYFASQKVDAVDLFTGKSYIWPLINFFQSRRRKQRG